MVDTRVEVEWKWWKKDKKKISVEEKKTVDRLEWFIVEVWEKKTIVRPRDISSNWRESENILVDTGDVMLTKCVTSVVCVSLLDII